jgi:hypothetical protein
MPDGAIRPEWHPERYSTTLTAEEPGAELSFAFAGTTIGLFWLVAPDSGDIEYSLDGSAPQQLSSWDVFALQFIRPSYHILSDSLAPGEHELCLRVSHESHPQSKGHSIRLLALLVDAP